MTERAAPTRRIDEARSRREADLARDLDALRRGLEADSPPSPDDVRRRIDAIADAFIDLDETQRAGRSG